MTPSTGNSQANNGNPGRSTVRLAPMAVPKASDVLAHELREHILSGAYQEGTPLPPERELVVQTGMSRTTVREALRILEVQGLVRIKAGRAGGAFVTTPGGESVASSIALLIRGKRIRLSSIHESREILEPACARLAASNRTDEDLAELDRVNQLIEHDGSLESFLQANVDWHVGVARATHNEILSAMMLALSNAIYSATNNEGFVDETVRSITARAHKSVTDAIRNQDADAAVRRMSRHVHAYAEAASAVDERTSISLDGDS